MRLYALVRLEIEGGAGATLIVEPGAAFEVEEDLGRQLLHEGKVSTDKPYQRVAMRNPEQHRQMRAG